jgi:hypothetical protein
MTAVTIQFRENRLAKMVLEPGGVRQDVAVAAASKNLEAIQTDCVAEVDQAFELIKAAAAAPDATQNVKVQKKIYAQSNRIAGLAGSCGLGNMGVAAFSLCELVDRQIITGAWNAKAVSVHIDAMALLRGRDAELPLEGQQQILAGLKNIATRIPLGDQGAG